MKCRTDMDDLTKIEQTLTIVSLGYEIRRMTDLVNDNTVMRELRESYKLDRDTLFSAYKKLGGLHNFEQLTAKME
jgi:hypothetical protein